MLTRPLRSLLVGSLLAFGTAAVLLGGRTAGTAPSAPEASGILVAFKDRIPTISRVDALRRHGLDVDPSVRSAHFVKVRPGPAAQAAGATLKTMIRALRADPTVRVAEPDYVVRASLLPNDPSFAQLWGLHNTGQDGGTADADIDAPEAWDQSTGSASVVVAVIDTGVDYDHPDLADNIFRDGANQVIGFDYANNDPFPMDDNDHGTHCAGTIGGRGNNAVGVAGVCWNVKIMPLKFLNAAGSGDTSDAIECIDFARLNGAHIMSNSWGGGGASQLLLEAIQRARNAGILFVAAAGNDGRSNDTTPTYPANYNSQSNNMLSVAATDRNDQLATFSNFGLTVDLAAPGVTILSTTRANTYQSFNGTSMATPHVAGAAALLKARFPAITVAELKARLLGSVDVLPQLAGKTVTSGRLNLGRAIESEITPPSVPGSFIATDRAARAVRLTWTAPGDDAAAGKASSYDLRYSTAPIDLGNFAAATSAPAPAPAPSGTGQATIVTGLSPSTAYFFALRALDNAGNPSALATAGPVTTLSAGTLLNDDVEGALAFTPGPFWAVTTAQSSSPTHSYGVAPGNNTDSSLTQSNAVLLASGDPVLTFMARTDLELSFDSLRVEVSTDGGTNWQPQGQPLTGVTGWQQYSFPLTPYLGANVKVRFRLQSDSSVISPGAWVDDIRIESVPVTFGLTDDVEGAPLHSGPLPWAVTTESASSPTHSYTDSPGVFYANDLNIALSSNGSVSLAGFVPTLTFRARIDLETAYDLLIIEASRDGGATWAFLGSLSGQNIGWGSYFAPLNHYTGENVRIRFRLVTDEAITRDGVWIDDIRIGGPTLQAVGAAPSIAVTAPNGGETWTIGSNQNITWSSANLPGNVKIDYSTNNGGNWTAVTASTPNDGSFQWTIPNTPSTQALVRVSAVDDSATDQSNAVFTIAAAPTVTVTAPNGGENWTIGSNQNITWSSANLPGNVKIDHSTNNGGNWTAVTASTPNDGSFQWTIPNTPSTQALVRVSAVDDSATDQSNAVFTIAAAPVPTITVTAPNGGENWTVLTNQNITWSSSNVVGNVKIDYSTDNGTNWTAVTASTANDGSFQWTIPNTPSTQALVRVSAVDDSATDQSNGVFTIAAAPVPTITVSAPNGGQSWPAGSNQNIAWTSANVAGNVKLEYSATGGAPWTLISASTANDGTQAWTIPNNPTTQAKVRVSNLDDSASDTSDAAFTITAPPSADLNGNGRIDVGDVQIINNVALGTVTYVPALHDFNQNGVKDAGDVQMVVDAFLGVGVTAERRRGPRSAGSKPKKLKVGARPGLEPTTALAFEVNLGTVAVQSIALGFVRGDLVLRFSDLGGGKHRILVYSNSNTPFVFTKSLVLITVIGKAKALPVKPGTGVPGAEGAAPTAELQTFIYKKGAKTAASVG